VINSVTVRIVADCVPVLIQQNVDGSNFFNRSWAEFKVGFNDSSGNYWLGNDLLHQLTKRDRYKVRWDVQALNLSWYYEEYNTFAVQSEANNYRLQVSGFSGNAGDGLSYHDGMMFTTYDRDNDRSTSSSYRGNCALKHGGGFWFNDCSWASINSVRRTGLYKWWSFYSGNLWLQSTRMWLTC